MKKATRKVGALAFPKAARALSSDALSNVVGGENPPDPVRNTIIPCVRPPGEIIPCVRPIYR